jgi:hypothetical protein
LSSGSKDLDEFDAYKPLRPPETKKSKIEVLSSVPASDLFRNPTAVVLSYISLVLPQ